MHITGEAMECIRVYVCRGVVIVMKWAETSVITLDFNFITLCNHSYIKTIPYFFKTVHQNSKTLRSSSLLMSLNFKLCKC